MNKFCPYCQSEITDLNVVKEGALEWNGSAWVNNPQAAEVIQCPKCGDEFDVIDLGILGITYDIIKEATMNPKINQKKY